MAKEKVTYKEPKSYFTPGMLKAAQKWEKENAQKSNKSTSTTQKGKK